MTRFLNGPAEGQTLMLRRAPIFLRVVEKAGKWDALDQLGDSPESGETLHAYRISKRPQGHVHLNAGKASGFYSMASYLLCEKQPTAEEMRDSRAWESWCRRMVSNQPLIPDK